MTVCPFCKKAVVNPNGGPCPSCGKVDSRAAQQKPPAAAAAKAGGGGGDEWDDLEIQRGSAGTQPTGPSSYAGGGLGGLGDDDEDSNGPGLSLELDTPVRSQAPPNMAPQQPSAAPPGPGAPGRAGASGGHPAYRNEPMPQPLPARSQSNPAMAQQSSPNSMSPSSSSQVAVQQPQQAPPSMPYGPGQGGPQMAPGGPPDAAVMIARYPAPPAKWWQTPAYAIRVLLRQFELRQDIAALRKKRSPDVQLYERALKTHDGTNFMIGLAISIAVFTVATFIFFLPVILRFVRDPD